MKYAVDHDMHIHSQLSLCSDHPEQTTNNILEYAIKNNFKRIVLTDHFWDAPIANDNKEYRDFYEIQNYEHISRALPLPKNDKVEFLFGCEADMDCNANIGILRETCDKFDFVVMPTTHFHFYFKEKDSIEVRAKHYIKCFEKLLDSDLPLYKVGIAHLTCPLIANMDWESHMKVLEAIKDSEFEYLFTRAREARCGIELNIPIFKYSKEDLPRGLRPYEIAKACGCKFYLGSDAHIPTELDEAKKRFDYIVDLLDLCEEDKYFINKK